MAALKLLGLREYAAAFFKALSNVYHAGAKSAIGSVTFGYWQRAVAMRYFMLADISGNREGLQAVLNDMEQFKPRFRADCDGEAPDVLVNLGDTVGYMPNPNEVMDALWPKCNVILPGNHELDIARLLYCTGQERNSLQVLRSEEVFWAMDWTRRALSPLNRQRLTRLAEEKNFVVRKGNLVFAHASPALPERMYYIDNVKAAKELFFDDLQFRSTIAFVGHVHVPQIYRYSKEARGVIGGQITFDRPTDGQVAALEQRWRLKSGDTAVAVLPSVGQPRDRLYYSGYAIYDGITEELIVRRVPYDVAVTQRQMQSLDFPILLWGRLAQGV